MQTTVERDATSPQRSSGSSGLDAAPSAPSAPEGARWRAHPVISWALRTCLVLVPSLGAAALTYALGQRVPRPGGVVGGGAWWLAMLLLATACYVVVERATRRLLPLAALLRLSLVFPDQTPSRYGLALRAGSTKRLQVVVERAQAGVLGETPGEAAEAALVLIAALNRHDRLTRGHSERVRALAEVIGERMGLDPRERELLRWSAMLHDIGKLCVPSEILNKPGKLTEDEFATIKRHPEEGERLVAPLLEWLGDAANAIGQHHERFDGGGYPRRLAGTEIGLPARIVSVADTFDVITSARSYKRPMSAAAGRREIARCSGTQFDPAVVRALLDVSIGRLWLLGGPLTWLTSVPLLGKVPLVNPTTPSLATLAPAVGNLATAGIVAGSVLGISHATPTAPREVAVAAAVQHSELGVEGGTDRTGRPGAAAAAASGSAADDGTAEADRGAVDGTATADTDADAAAADAAGAPIGAPGGEGAAEPTAGTEGEDLAGGGAGGSTAAPGTSGGEARAATPTDPSTTHIASTSPGGSTTSTPHRPGGPVTEVVDGVVRTVDGVGQTVDGVGRTVDGVVGGVTGAVPLPGGAGGTVNQTVDGVTDVVGGTVDKVTKGIGGLLGRRR